MKSSNHQKRYCEPFEKSYFLDAFEESTNKIMKKYSDSSNFIRDQGIKHLSQIYQQYLNAVFPPQSYNFTFQASHASQLEHFPAQKNKKQLVFQNKITQEQDFSQNQNGQININENLNKSSKKSNHLLTSERKILPKYNQKSSFKKSHLKNISKFQFDEEDADNEQNEQNENQNAMNLEDLKNKTIEEIIEESNEKIKRSRKKPEFVKDDRNSDSSYEMTEYSSNESSNQNEYKEEYKDESESNSQSEPSTLFGNKFLLQKQLSQKSSNNSLLLSKGNSSSSLKSLDNSKPWMGFQPSKITNSPKKDKKQNKRLFIRNKKIPKWAEDMEKVKERVILQRNNHKMNPNLIYGVCIVENLDTNLIFKSQDDYTRGSSAKWNRFYNFAE